MRWKLGSNINTYEAESMVNGYFYQCANWGEGKQPKLCKYTIYIAPGGN